MQRNAEDFEREINRQSKNKALDLYRVKAKIRPTGKVISISRLLRKIVRKKTY
jgi:hypothetical protein